MRTVRSRLLGFALPILVVMAMLLLVAVARGAASGYAITPSPLKFAVGTFPGIKGCCWGKWQGKATATLKPGQPQREIALTVCIGRSRTPTSVLTTHACRTVGPLRVRSVTIRTGYYGPLVRGYWYSADAILYFKTAAGWRNQQAYGPQTCWHRAGTHCRGAR
jgi:hypothetical protein